jgi:hypothetical protein
MINKVIIICLAQLAKAMCSFVITYRQL